MNEMAPAAPSLRLWTDVPSSDDTWLSELQGTHFSLTLISKIRSELHPPPGFPQVGTPGELIIKT